MQCNATVLLARAHFAPALTDAESVHLFVRDTNWIGLDKQFNLKHFHMSLNYYV